MSARAARARPVSTENAFRTLLRTFGLIKRIQEPFFARFGITASQWGVLRALARAEGEGLARLRLTDLGERLIIRPPSVTGVVDRLQRLGLVARAASDADLRVKYVSLTPEGRRLLGEVHETHAARIRALLAGLSPKEQESLNQILARLESHLRAFAEQQDGASPDEAEAASSQEARNSL